MIHHVIQRLSASTTITDETGTRIFPLFRLQGSETPAITVQLVGTEPADTKDSTANFESHTVEITVFHTDPASAWTLATASRTQLDGWSDANVKHARFVNQATDIFEATEVFSVTQRYEIQMDK